MGIFHLIELLRHKIILSDQLPDLKQIYIRSLQIRQLFVNTSDPILVCREYFRLWRLPQRLPDCLLAPIPLNYFRVVPLRFFVRSPLDHVLLPFLNAAVTVDKNLFL